MPMILALLAPAVPCGARAAAPEPERASFLLRAAATELADYTPTYLANGYLSLLSTPGGVQPAASQLAGLMDYTPDDVSRPAALPAWNGIDFRAGDAWLGSAPIRAATHDDYSQVLDMQLGTLHTHYRWRTGNRSSDIDVLSLVSQDDPHLALVLFSVRPDADGTVEFRFTLQPGAVPERLPMARMGAQEFARAASREVAASVLAGGQRKAIWYPGEVRVDAMEGDAKDHSISLQGHAAHGRDVALAFTVGAPAGLADARWRFEPLPDVAAITVSFTARANTTYTFAKYVAVTTPGWGGDAAHALLRARAARAAGADALRAAHERRWRALWAADIVAVGDAALQRAIHADLYYLLSNTADDSPWPVAACGPTPNYFGHVFWDSDAWVFPALLLLHPRRAAALVGFRSRTLAQAEARAARHGYAGAMYPWESDPWTGDDQTPEFARVNADREVHVNAAVALAQWQYYLASGDRDWLRAHGWPVLGAVADFWASRASWDEHRQHSGLLHLTSVEEDYTDVDNEAYTNTAAWRSVQAAIAAAGVLGIAPDPRWLELERTLYIPPRDAADLHDFDTRTPHDLHSSWMGSSLPMLSLPVLDYRPGEEVLQRVYARARAEVGATNDRTNQMVRVMAALQAASVGDQAAFEDYVGGGPGDPFLKPPFDVRSETPQKDALYLLASSGGFLQDLLYGATGLRLGADGLEAVHAPLLPRELRELVIRGATVRGRRVDVLLERSANGRVQRSLRSHGDAP